MSKVSFDNLLDRYRTKDLSKVIDFLSSMSRRSKRTALAYSFALEHFDKFILLKHHSNYNIQTILDPLKQQSIDVYTLLDQFVEYLQSDAPNAKDLSPKSIQFYMTATRSYLSYNDVEITSTKFKHRVKMPSVYREDEQPLDVKDIREILLACTNRRLKAYLLVLASGGMRAIEALAIRLQDLDFTTSPTKVHIRKEFAKTRVARDVYISDEASHYLKQWIDFKYRDRHAENRNLKNRIRSENDIVFSLVSIHNRENPQGLYSKILHEFQKVLDLVNLSSRKEEGVYKRHKITLHSFRRFVKTIMSKQVDADYSEWFLGHSKSPYYTLKEPERRSIYADQCMPYFTYLDYNTLEATGQDIQKKLAEKDKQIQRLEQRDTTSNEAITKLQEQLTKLQEQQSMLQSTLLEIMPKQYPDSKPEIFKVEKDRVSISYLKSLRDNNRITEKAYNTYLKKMLEKGITSMNKKQLKKAKEDIIISSPVVQLEEDND